MSSVVISGDTSGSVSVTVPAVAGTNTATLPAATGTVMVSGNMPAFSARKITTAQSISTAVNTKVTFNSVDFDTNSNFASSTTFTPTVAGYYIVTASAAIAISDLTGTGYTTYIYKNGVSYANQTIGFGGNNGQTVTPTTTAVIYMNGSTDYVEVYAYGNTATGTVSIAAAAGTRFTASLVRAA